MKKCVKSIVNSLVIKRYKNINAFEAAKEKLKDMKANIKKLEKDVQTLCGQIDRS